MQARQQQQAALQSLYEQYGGSDVARAVQDVADEQTKPAEDVVDAFANTLLGELAGAAKELDRLAFDQTCLAVGRGEAQLMTSEKGRVFFAREDVMSGCTQAAVRAAKIERLEASLGL